MNAVSLAVPAASERPASLARYLASSGLRSLVVGVSRDPNAKVTVLLVDPTTGRPVLAAKAPTTDLACRAVERERSLLEGIHVLLPARLARRKSDPVAPVLTERPDLVTALDRLWSNGG